MTSHLQQHAATARRVCRQSAIVTILSNGKIAIATRLAAAMQVSERTIYRDMRQLQRKYPGIIGEAGAGYIMRHCREAGQ